MQGTKDAANFSTNFGWNFFTDDSNVSTVYFPASGLRDNFDGSLGNVKGVGYYWSAVPNYVYYGCYLYLSSGIVNPLSNTFRANGFSVRPVTE